MAGAGVHTRQRYTHTGQRKPKSFGHYEEEVSGGSTTEIRHYSFGSLRIAVKRGSTLYHSTWPERPPLTSRELANIPAEAKKLHGDHLVSTSLTTQGSSTQASRAYYAYGAERSASGNLQTHRTFTGQKSDASGLLYYNARYYDPSLGTFISPDSMVPGAGQVINYKRFLYARGNPLKYTDPSGHASAESIQNWKANAGIELAGGLGVAVIGTRRVRRLCNSQR